ncbi:MAG: dipeptidase, partial [Ignavibacteriales bacterium]|nr:dipeptidase [Ignavibacteriales bacterium]
MQQVLAYLEENIDRYLNELKEFLAIPSVSSQTDHTNDMRRCAEWIARELQRIGMQNIQILDTPGHPVVFGEWLGAPGKPTVLLYGHYDVQPVDPVELWTTPPFEATIRDGNLYARGSTDDKGQIFAHFKALEAYMKNAGGLPMNVKIIGEGEEEIGSDHLDDFVKEHKDLLKADLVLISDSDMFAKGVPSVCYALRGLAYMEIEVTGPNGDLHSGTFGGTVHNPIQALAEMIASLHDKNGRITIPGFYDDVRPLTGAERQAFRKLPWNDKKYAKSLGVKELYGEKGFSSIERRWARPTLECNGI